MITRTGYFFDIYLGDLHKLSSSIYVSCQIKGWMIHQPYHNLYSWYSVMSYRIFIMRSGERETLTAAIVSLQHIHIIYNMILPFNSFKSCKLSMLNLSHPMVCLPEYTWPLVAPSCRRLMLKHVRYSLDLWKNI